jgi:hypothetical protein
VLALNKARGVLWSFQGVFECMQGVQKVQLFKYLKSSKKSNAKLHGYRKMAKKKIHVKCHPIYKALL